MGGEQGGKVSLRLSPSLSPGSQSLDRDTINTKFANMSSKNSSGWQGPPGTGCTFAAFGLLSSEHRLSLSASMSLCPPQPIVKVAAALGPVLGRETQREDEACPNLNGVGRGRSHPRGRQRRKTVLPKVGGGDSTAHS